MNYIEKELIKNKDLKYKEFNDKIINTKYKTIGVRMDVLKNIVKNIIKENKENMIYNLNNDYYEHVILKGLLIANGKDLDTCLKNMDKYLDLIDSWAICDSVCSSSKVFKKDLGKVLKFVDKNIYSKYCFRVRFAFVTLLNYFILEDYIDIIFKYCNEDKNNDYYIMMAKAWLISTCYIKFKDKTIKFLKNTKIDDITYNKAISKICDSLRVSKDEKSILKNMKKMSKNA